MRRRASLGLWFVLAGCGCRETPPLCDERALDQAARELEDGIEAGALWRGPSGAEARAIDALIEACPTINSSLVRALKHAYTDDRGARSGSLVFDRRLGHMQRALCVDADALEREVAARPSAERAELMYEVCDLGRFGLLEPGEAFMQDDLTGVLLFGWLIGHEVDPGVARRFVRGLMRTTATPAAAQRRCRIDNADYGCVVAARAEGIELPRSTSPWTFEPWVVDEQWGDSVARISMSQTAVRVDGEHVADLVEGRFVETTLGPVPALRDLILGAPESCVITADRALTSGALLRVMSKAESCSLVVEGLAETRRIPLNSSLRWRFGPGLGPEAVRARIDTTAVHFMLPYMDTLSIPIADVAVIEATAKAIAAERTPRIGLWVADSLPVGQLVSALDALRGRSCRASEFEMRDCWLWDPILDFDPPFNPRQSPWDWSRIELSVSPKPVTRQRAAVEAALPSIRKCLLDSPRAAEEMPKWMVYSFEVDAEGELVVRPLVPELADGPLSTCLLDALGQPRGSSADAKTPATVTLTIDVPVRAPDQNR